MTNFRELCDELLDELKYQTDWSIAEELKERARAALAEPEPEEPTDEEIMELMPQQMRDDLAAAARAMSGFNPDNIKAASVFRIILNRHSVDHARAVLAHWGNHPTPQPVPVSERWPEFSDCDSAERVWCWSWAIGTWRLSRINQSIHSHWLPAHALPLPSHD